MAGAPPKKALLILEGCRAVAHEAIMYVSKHEAHLADNEFFDSEGIIGAGHFVLDIEDEPEEGLWTSHGPPAVVEQAPRVGPWHFNGHSILQAEVFPDMGSNVKAGPPLLFCQTCGAHVHKQHKPGHGLAIACKGENHPGLHTCRVRLRAKRHPHTSIKASIGPTVYPVQELREKWAKKLGGDQQVQEVAAGPSACYGLQVRHLPLEQALRAFGFQDEQKAMEAGRASIKAARAARKDKLRTAADQELSFEEGLEAFML